jgi:hypothetical protein
MHRQLFLTEQGYRFFIEDMTHLPTDPLDTPELVARALEVANPYDEDVDGLLN